MSRIGEVSNVRGLLGSKAYADIVADREKTQAKTNADIAGGATAMRESLLQNKRNQDYNLYNLYSGALSEYDAKSQVGLGATSQLSGMLNNFNQNSWATTTNAMIANYQNQLKEYEANDPWRNYVAPILQTGAMLYGQKTSDRRLKKNIAPLLRSGMSSSTSLSTTWISGPMV